MALLAHESRNVSQATLKVPSPLPALAIRQTVSVGITLLNSTHAVWRARNVTIVHPSAFSLANHSRMRAQRIFQAGFFWEP